MHLAAFFGHGDIANLLIENGADINAQSHNKFHATPLQSAAAAQKEQVGEILLKAHATPNCKGDGGYSPLHEVASNGQISFAELLLRYGADVNFRGDDGKTPLTIALESKQEAMAQFLRGKAGTK